MLSLSTDKLSEQELNRIMIGSIVPRPIAFVSSVSAEGLLNLAPFSFFNIVSSVPPLISISILHGEDRIKDTVNNIKNNQEFVVHIVTEEILEDVNQTSIELPANRSELLYTHFSIASSEKIKVPQIQEAKIRMECVLETIIPMPASDLIIGRVVNFIIDENIIDEKGKIIVSELKPISRLAGNQYAKVGEIIKMNRPKL